MRRSGILLPIFSLPSPYGIGCFSNEAKVFIDKLSGSGQMLWQILPLGPTSFGDSPYQSPSAFAGNHYFIDIDTLKQKGLLTEGECEEYKNRVPKSNRVDYGFLYETRHQLLKKAFERFKPTPDYYRFIGEESYWLKNYAEFSAVKDYFGGLSLMDWDEPLRKRDEKALSPLLTGLVREIEYYKFLQYEFMCQWLDIKDYANRRGIQIIGDIPIYTAMDSADLWAEPKLFKLDKDLRPTHVAGCPPDSFSPLGQLWGNPVYNWTYHKENNFHWWTERMKRCMRLYDIVRIDHFRGFESYYEVPYGEATAENGMWEKGPGTELFDALNKNCLNLNIIAEDLGFITEEVKDFLKKTGYPGMKVMQFAFDCRADSDYLPHNYEKNTVVYTGTHDNSTTLGWEKTVNKEDLEFARSYMGTDNVCDGMIRLSMASVADTCIIPMQDYLGLDDSARINTPSSLGGNWGWRMGDFSEETEKKIYSITETYRRIPSDKIHFR